MKTAGIVLSIIGVIFAGISALIYFSAALAMASPDFLPQTAESVSFDLSAILTPVAWVLALLLGTCVALGIIGAVKINGKGLTAGILHMIAAVLCAVTVYGFPAAVCFLLSGIFAFVTDKRASLDPAPVKFNYLDDDDESEEFDMGM